MRVGCSRKLSSSTAAWSLDRRSFFLEPSIRCRSRLYLGQLRCVPGRCVRGAPSAPACGLPLAAGDLTWHRAAARAPGRAAPAQRHCRAAPAPGRRERTDLGLTSGGLQRCSPQPAAATGDGQARRRRGRASEDGAAGDGRAGRGSGERPNGPTGQGWGVGLTHFWAV